MAEVPDGQSIAVIGLACRFPDADDPPALLDMVLTGRRAFRRLPPCRVDLADYYSPDRATPDATYSSRAALIEGWQFDQAAFQIAGPTYLAADPAHWLALETVARALAAAGFPGGAGLPRDRVGVIIGNTLTGDYSRAVGLRLRWPYVRRVLAEALVATDIPAAQARQVLCDAATRYLAPFPAAGDQTLAGSIPSAIASGICGYFGFRGSSLAVDGAGASSLLAVASACSALSSGDLDVALAGGVDLSLDPLELVGLAKSGVLATGEVRVYDQNPTGFLPGEGCGVVVLMRAGDARAARLPVYAEIAGWGSSAAGQARPGLTPAGQDGDAVTDSEGQLLAMRRAYQRAGIDPADVQLIEGNGNGTAAGDEAELRALATLRAGATDTAALGSVKANIGHAKAAAGSAGLIKTVLALGTGVIPPATGFSTPHSLLCGGDAALRLPRSPERWPDGTRLAGVSSMSPGGLNAHLVLRHEPGRAARHDRPLAASALAARPGSGRSAGFAATASPAAGGAPRSLVYLMHAPDRHALAAALARLAGVAPWLSDSELQDLACQLARAAKAPGPVRIAMVASSAGQLAQLAGESLALLPELAVGLLTQRPGIFAADGADGRVTLLMSGASRPAAGLRRPASQAILAPLAALGWLSEHGVHASAAVADGIGEIAGLAWAGCISDAEAVTLAALRAEILTDAAAAHAGGQEDTARQEDSRHQENSARLRAAAARCRFSPPRRRLISTITGRELASADAITDLLCAGPGPASRLDQAVAAGAAGASLLVEIGPGRALLAAADRVCRVPAVCIPAGQHGDGAAGGTADGAAGDAADGTVDGEAALAAAALFAAGALADARPLFAGRPARPIDIWRDRIFVTSPCQAPPRQQADTEPATPESPATESPVTAAQQAAAARLPAAAAAARPVTTASRPAAASSTAAVSPDVTPSVTGPVAAPTSSSSTASAAGRAGPVPGVSPWARCYVEHLRSPQRPVLPADDRPWRLRAADGDPFGVLAVDLFRHDPDADRTLAVIGGQADPDTCAAALGAARDAISTGRLVVITHGTGLAGFWATLHAEHPSLGITVLRAPASADGLRAASGFAAAVPGEFRELVIDTAGLAREVAMTPAALPGGAFPLGSDDVLLVSRESGGTGLVLAQVLGCCGAAVAVVGRAGQDEDGKVVAGLEELRSAGARVAFEVIDIGNAADRMAALRRIERRLGPVTAIGHAVGTGRPVPVTGLAEAELRRRLAAATAGLTRLVGGVDTSRLTLIATFGSVAGRYGLAGQGLLALESASLAGQAERLAGSIPGCRGLHVDWPAWAGAGLGQAPAMTEPMEQAGVTPIEVGEASRLLLKTLATPGLPARLAVHGRAGLPAPRPIRGTEPSRPGAAGPGRPDAAEPDHADAAESGQTGAGRLLAGRFIEVTRVHYPGVELVCEASLSLQTDPYLADYRVDGIPVFPPTMALEAMAQAASVLAGRPLRRAAAVSMDAPVVIPAGTADSHALIRLCALRDAGTVTVVLRCAESGFGVDHFRAEFCCDDDASRPAGSWSAGSSGVDELTSSVTGIVDGAELYGPICFQSGRFRRVAILPEVTSRSCKALARGADDQPWFGRGSAVESAGRSTAGSAGSSTASSAAGSAAGRVPEAELILGSPGLSDATLHALQACVPHRRLLPAGCESVTFSGRTAVGAVEIRAVAVPSAAADLDPAGECPPGPAAASHARILIPRQRPAAQSSSSSRRSPAVPRQAARPPARAPQHSPAEHLWDVQAVDATGRPLLTWRRLRLRDAGPLPRNAAWPPSLLSIYLERQLTALGLDPRLRVAVECGQPGGPPRPAPARVSPQLPQAGSAGPAGPAGPTRRTWSSRSVAGISQLKGFTLRARGGDSVACGWAAAEPTAGPAPDEGPGLAKVRAQIRLRLAEQSGTIAARMRAITDCLVTAETPAGCPVTVSDMTRDGWVLLSVAGARLACVAVEISGVSCPVAIAVMTGTPGQDSGRPGRAQPARSRSPRATARS